jgi:hypothetical protein
VEWPSVLAWNHYPDYCGILIRFPVESLTGLAWNIHYDQIRILSWDIKRLRRDNPQRALFENVERAADLAQAKINTDI